MKNIKNFRINPNQESHDNIRKIKEEIEEIASHQEMLDLSTTLSELIEVPSDILNMKVKQIIYNKFDYLNKIPRFKLSFNIFDTIKYSIFFIFLTLINKTSQFKKESVDVILDNVEKPYVVEKFKKLLFFFKKPLVITNKKVIHQLQSSYQKFIFLDEYKFLFSNNLIFKKKYKILKFLTKIIFLSVKNNLNLLPIFFTIFFTSLKYHKIFNRNYSKFLIFDRIYHSCPVRNYLFKKYGGKETLCVQSHLAEATISVFSNLDTLVTFGKEKDTSKKLQLLGGKVNRYFPCGSIRMEHGLENEESSKLIEEIDILFIGLNPTIWLGTSKKISEIYYEQMKWVLKISEKFPSLNIIYKHHPNFKGDIIENKIFETSNIKTIIVPKENVNSYHYLIKSQLILSFGSTMILEGLSLGKPCFFLDPEFSNSAFFENLEYLKDKRIKSYKVLDEIVTDFFTRKNKSKIFFKETEKFCLPYQKASETIFNYIKKNR